jgi:hypothetical protein
VAPALIGFATASPDSSELAAGNLQLVHVLEEFGVVPHFFKTADQQLHRLNR